MRSNPEANARVHGPHATPDEILTFGDTAARPPPEFNPLHQLLQVLHQRRPLLLSEAEVAPSLLLVEQLPHVGVRHLTVSATKDRGRLLNRLLWSCVVVAPVTATAVAYESSAVTSNFSVAEREAECLACMVSDVLLLHWPLHWPVRWPPQPHVFFPCKSEFVDWVCGALGFRVSALEQLGLA